MNGDDMYNYEPCGQQNAIQSATFGFAFDGPISKDRIVLVADDNVFPDLPRIDKGIENSLQVEISSDGQQILSQANGGGELSVVERKKFNTSGDVSVVFSMEKDRFFITFFEYTKWELIVPEALQVLQDALEIISPINRKIVSAVHHVVDEFWWQGDGPQDGGLLLSEDSPYIARKALEANSPSFHSYCGWFDNVGGLQVLNRLNVDAGPASVLQSRPKGEFGVKLDHFIQTFFDVRSQAPSWGWVFEESHKKNLEVMRSILSKSAKEQVGL